MVAGSVNRRRLVLQIIVALALPHSALAQADQGEEPAIEPRAKEIVEQARQRIDNARTISAEITKSLAMRSPNMKQDIESRFE